MPQESRHGGPTNRVRETGDRALETGRKRYPASSPRSPVSALTDMDLAAMEGLALSLGQPAFRGRQLFSWVHSHLETELDRMSSLPRGFRAEVAERHSVARMEMAGELASVDGATRKRLLRLRDGQRVEAVLMESPDPGHEAGRHTVCVSSQVGCALGCVFCVTGQVGFVRQLSPGEMVEQVYHFERMLRHLQRSTTTTSPARLVDNVVFMGMGEPLANYQSVMAAIRLLTSPHGLGLGARRITVSTAGLVPGIERMAAEGMQLGLAISLHAGSDQLRTRLMPINRRYPLAQVMDAAGRYAAVTGRRVTYEYALIHGINDSEAQARQLSRLLSRQLCHVNLIPLNQSLDPSLRPSTPERIAAFQRVLQEVGIPCTLRQTRGEDILAACGQLRYTAE